MVARAKVRNMLNRYTIVNTYKEDIKQYVTMLNIDEIYTSKLTSIIKSMQFFNIIYTDKCNCGHYKNMFKMGLIETLHTLTLNSKRMFYFCYRSLIENFVRICLIYDDKNETGIRNMLIEFREKFFDEEKFINYVEGEYGKCCEVVHSNIKSNTYIVKTYQEMLMNDDLCKNEINHILNQYNKFLSECKKFIIKNNIKLIEMKFYNQNEVLFYLIGKKLYLKMEKASQ